MSSRLDVPLRGVGGERGVALVAVLWVLTLIAMIAAGHTVAARTDLSLARNLESTARAEALADAGVVRGVVAVIDNRMRGGRGLPPELQQMIGGNPEQLAMVADLLKQRPELKAQIAEELGKPLDDDDQPAEEEAWPLDGTPVAWRLAGADDGAVVTIAIQDEGRRVDLNSADDTALIGLFEAVGLAGDEARTLTDAIRDFADGDDSPRASGAEATAYRSAGRPRAPKNARFQAPEELRQVLGMTPALYALVAPAITVWSGSKGVDPALITQAALAAVPELDPAQVESLLGGGVPGGALQPGLLGAGGGGVLNPAPRGILRIRAEARTADGASFVREAVVHVGRGGPTGQPFDVMFWGRAAQAAAADSAATDD